MNIKSLLLGSAAALATVSGAHAADAIVAAAPEPMEYVKVCDAFGKGYFYIPGTETCLNLSGMVRYQINMSSAAIMGPHHVTSYSGNTFARLEVNAKNDSEYGTVYSFMRIQAGSTEALGGTDKYVSGFYAGIGGFEVGKFDTAWTRFFGYGGFTDDGGRYGFMSNAYGAFQGNAGALSYIISADDLTSTAGKSAGINGAVKGTFGDFGAMFGVAYDVASKSAAFKGYVTGKVDIVSFKIGGLYSASGTNVYTQNIKGFTLAVDGKVDITSSLFLGVDYSYSFTPKNWNIQGDLGWNVAPGFAVLANANYDSGTKVKAGFLRFERTF
jgi:hypothetical protein